LTILIKLVRFNSKIKESFKGRKMEITVNGESQLMLDNEATISRLLEIRKVESPDMVAVQLNGVFVELNSYSTTTLNQDDDVEFLFFMGGGTR
jgi:sulfur carrier protein